MIKWKYKATGRPDWILLCALVALLAIGLMMVYSATSNVGYRDTGDPAHYFKHQALWLGVGLVGFLVASWLHHTVWMKLSIPLMVLTLGLLIFLAITRSRLLIGQSVSPSELAKLAVVIYIGHWLASKGDLLRRLPYGLLPFTIMVGLIAGLVMAQPDTSEAVVIMIVSVAMFFAAGADPVQFLIGMAGGLATFALVATQVGEGMERLGSFLAQWQDPLAEGEYQVRQGLIAIGSGGPFGLGPGNGRMKYQWLPLPHNDSILAIVGEELGFVGCLALIGLYVLLVYRGLRIASDAPDTFGRMLAVGVTSWIGFQALINALSVTATIPFTGTTLPFISAGGSSLVSCLVATGIMVSVSRATNAQRSNYELRRSAMNQHRTSSFGTLP